MARLTRLNIEGFRSVRDLIEIDFPTRIPVVLVGENNAGKSNIVRAVDLMLGEWWPGTREPEDHEFWDRQPGNGPIKIRAHFEGMTGYGHAIDELYWKTTTGDEPVFRAILEDGTERFVKKEIRDQCMCYAIGADRRLSYQLSYTSKFTLLAKLMRKFHSKLTEEAPRVERLKAKFEEVREIFDEVTEFGSFQTELTNQFGEMFGGMSYGLQVDFSAYDPSNFFHSLRMQAVENGKVRTLEELGTGQEQLLALAFAHAYAKAFYGGIFLAIEEPEAHLHPLAQEWLARRIRKMCSDGLQILITTHSPSFVDLLGVRGIVLVTKDEGVTSVKQLSAVHLTDYCKQHGAHPTRTREDTILGFYAGSSTHEVKAGFFAKKIILVEGATEALSLPVYLRKVGLDVTKEGIAVIPMAGKGNLAKWWRLFTAYGIPTYITFDNDSERDPAASKRMDAMKAIGISGGEISAAVAEASWRITASYSVFGLDFESTMREVFSNYTEFEEEGKATLGDSKPLVARYVAEKMERNEGDPGPGWICFNQLADVLRNLSTPGETEAEEDDLPF